MHIIKISPASFKIILSKEDLKRHGVDNILENKNISGEFFAEIIEETNRLYGNPFSDGAIDAEFFEAKDGGGELFLCSSKKLNKSTVYICRTDNCEDLIKLCRLLKGRKLYTDSRLFCEDSLYSLLVFCPKRDEIFLSHMKEYGKAGEISILQMWLLEEHAKLVCEKDAIERLCGII